MTPTNLKTLFSKIRPSVERIAVDTAKGYAFGYVFGIFVPSKDPILKTMHKNGKNFAKMSATYTTAEIALESIRKKDCIYNKIVAGALAGAIGSKHGAIPGSLVFGGYSGAAHYLEKD